MNGALRKQYTSYEWGRLKRHVCFLCEHPLTSELCHSIFLPSGHRCTPEIMAKKRAECLAAGRSGK